MTRSLQTALYNSATEIRVADWEGLSAGKEIRLDQRWLTLNEQALVDARPIYFTFARNGHVVALAPCLVTRDDDLGWASYRATDPLLNPEELRGPDDPELDRGGLESARAGLASFRPLTAVSVVSPLSRYAPVTELLGTDDEVAPALVSELDALADREEAALWAILGVSADSALFARAGELGLLPALLSATAVMHAPWTSFDEYLQALPSRRRGMVRDEIKRSRARGIEIALEPDPIAVQPELRRILGLHRARYGRVGIPMPLEELAEAFGDDVRVIGARRDGQLLAAITLFARGRWNTIVHYGADHGAIERADLMYPNVAIYAAIADVTERGGGSISWGPTNYQTKLLRGCRLDPVWGLYRPVSTEIAAPLADYIERLNVLQTAHFLSLERFEPPEGRFLPAGGS